MDDIKRLQVLIKRIENLRKCMYCMIDKKFDLTDERVVKVSQKLDSILNEYNKYKC